MRVHERQKIILIDFDDSFTYNIAAELVDLDLEAEIISHRHLSRIKSAVISAFDQDLKLAIILGPGPGHPDDYPHISELLRDMENRKNLFILGICLGHQLYWSAKGHLVCRSFDPQHGQKVLLPIHKSWRGIFPDQLLGKSFLVQRYNSLFIDVNKSLINPQEKFIFINNELMVGKDQKAVTYQFHPESIGTSYPKSFFIPLIKFLYNGTDEWENKSRWSLRSKDTEGSGQVWHQ